MAKNQHNMFFAVKLVAPTVGKVKMKPATVLGTSPTKHCEDDPPPGKPPGKPFLTIGGKGPIDGVAGHFTAHILDFNDKEDKACKNAAEAEQLVKKNHKAWIADAYEWFVVPAAWEGVGGGKAASNKKPAKKKAAK